MFITKKEMQRMIDEEVCKRLEECERRTWTDERFREVHQRIDRLEMRFCEAQRVEEAKAVKGC